jgi:hypothetical protein
MARTSRRGQLESMVVVMAIMLTGGVLLPPVLARAMSWGRPSSETSDGARSRSSGATDAGPAMEVLASASRRASGALWGCDAWSSTRASTWSGGVGGGCCCWSFPLAWPLRAVFDFGLEMRFPIGGASPPLPFSSCRRFPFVFATISDERRVVGVDTPGRLGDEPDWSSEERVASWASGVGWGGVSRQRRKAGQYALGRSREATRSQALPDLQVGSLTSFSAGFYCIVLAMASLVHNRPCDGPKPASPLPQCFMLSTAYSRPHSVVWVRARKAHDSADIAASLPPASQRPSAVSAAHRCCRSDCPKRLRSSDHVLDGTKV